jgi:hypothetical protein
MSVGVAHKPKASLDRCMNAIAGRESIDLTTLRGSQVYKRAAYTERCATASLGSGLGEPERDGRIKTLPRLPSLDPSAVPSA